MVMCSNAIMVSAGQASHVNGAKWENWIRSYLYFQTDSILAVWQHSQHPYTTNIVARACFVCFHCGLSLTHHIHVYWCCQTRTLPTWCDCVSAFVYGCA